MRVSGIGARLSDESWPGQINYGQLQVTFADGSVGWYEAGWGPMMSETAFFVKDVIGPKGCVSIVAKEGGRRENHPTSIRIPKPNRCASTMPIGRGREVYARDELIDVTDEPNHDELCKREQEVFLRRFARTGPDRALAERDRQPPHRARRRPLLQEGRTVELRRRHPACA